ncbi:MAG: hypothetical protein KAX20_03300 [Candidatus Omnitrophica bacterium]|nr:hypothetical protein [Candidatus Omnitrophota bacterium]
MVVIEEVIISIMYIRISSWEENWRVFLIQPKTGLSSRTRTKNTKIPPAGIWSIAKYDP